MIFQKGGHISEKTKFPETFLTFSGDFQFFPSANQERKVHWILLSLVIHIFLELSRFFYKNSNFSKFSMTSYNFSKLSRFSMFSRFVATVLRNMPFATSTKKLSEIYQDKHHSRYWLIARKTINDSSPVKWTQFLLFSDQISDNCLAQVIFALALVIFVRRVYFFANVEEGFLYRVVSVQP